uniref:Uncharacterized protein n=1 Tax=Fagus sylvatica TaxID=28930 RepID=A0A2N9IIB0_FAGSY
MEEPEQGNSAQNRRDLEAYQSWRKKDRCARFTMLSSMHNDLIGEFESYGTAQDMWIALKAKFGGTTEHLRKMSAMVCELKAAGNNLTDEQQIQAVIRSLPDFSVRVAQGQSSAFFAKHGQRQAFKAKRKSYEKAPQQDTGAIDHVARDRVGFVEYRQVPARQQMDAYGERVKSGGAWDWHLQTPVASWTHPLTP